MPLPEIDPMLVVTDPPAMAAFNKQLIGEYRANGGRISGQLAGAPVLLLTTTGAKTGRPRTTPLSYVPHRHGYVVAASKAGAPTHPDWFHNLLADPTATVEVGVEQIPVRAIVTHGDDRASLYAQLSAAWPMMDDYQAATTREIPVVVLERSGHDATPACSVDCAASSSTSLAEETMIENDDTVLKIVQAYYDALTGGIASFDEGQRLRAILASDFVFEGPIAGRVVGAERFISGVSGFIETVRMVKMLRQLHAEGMAAALYEAEMAGGTVRFAEFFQIAGGKIQSIELVYDPAEYRARGGR